MSNRGDAGPNLDKNKHMCYNKSRRRSLSECLCYPGLNSQVSCTEGAV